MTPGVQADCVQACKATGGLGKGAKSTILTQLASQYPFSGPLVFGAFN